jgi:membrane-bound lytic murein transglycosylase A
MEPTSYNEIAGWAQDRHAEALVAFRRSCPKLTAGPDVRIATDGGEKTITAGEWARICEAAAGVKTGDARGSRTFFEQNFRPLIVQAPGKFTGYFEPELRGSKVPVAAFSPCRSIVSRPTSPTSPTTRARRSRRGALKGKGLEIAYVQDPVGLFEVQVQGSGRIQLAEGGTMTLGFDGSNNRPYTAIGAVLVEMGAMKKEDATWPAIRDWLKRNPQQAREVMRKNERYIFFRDTRTSAPIGAEGVALTAQRSMAVDPAITPYGTPVWIDTRRPVYRKPGATEPYRRLMIAQDAGAAIKGPARGDVFYGAGPQAAEWAGRMNSDGRAIILVPNKN